MADLVRTGTRSRGVRAGNDRSGPGRQSGSGGRVEHRPIRRLVRFPPSAAERNETGGAEERTASEASRTEKVEAVRAVFGSPVEIVLKREALKYAPHLGEHPVRYGPGERVLVAVSGFPERRKSGGKRDTDAAWTSTTSVRLDFSVQFGADEVERVASLPKDPLQKKLRKGPLGFSEGPVGNGEGRLELVALMKWPGAAFDVVVSLAACPLGGTPQLLRLLSRRPPLRALLLPRHADRRRGGARARDRVRAGAFGGTLVCVRGGKEHAPRGARPPGAPREGRAGRVANLGVGRETARVTFVAARRGRCLGL